jgi:hypothetical protein
LKACCNVCTFFCPRHLEFIEILEFMATKGNKRWKHIKGGPKLLWHYIVFREVPCLNFSHVIIMKDFHNVFAYYGRWKPK